MELKWVEQLDVANKYTDQIVSYAFETSSGLFFATAKAIFKLNSKTVTLSFRQLCVTNSYPDGEEK